LAQVWGIPRNKSLPRGDEAAAREADERGHQRHLAKFTNLDTGKTHVAECPIGKPGEPRAEQSGGQFLVPDWEYPSLWHVERRPIRPEEFLPVLEALERIFRTSVETGNPVMWC
jgi:hypothetical protein